MIFYKLERIGSSLIWAITSRYRNKEFRSNEFSSLLKFWCNLHLNKGDKLYNIDSNKKKAWNLEICKGVLAQAEDRGFKFYSEECKKEILEIIDELEMSPEAEKFGGIIAEVKHFPSYYSGYSSYQLRSYAEPVFKKLHEAFENLSETEKSSRKTIYENAQELLNRTIKKGGRGFF